MLFSASSAVLALGLAVASPLAMARPGGPSIIDGKGFFLAAYGGDLGSLDPENADSNAWALGIQRISQGVYATTVVPRSRDKTENTKFYFNGTASETTLNIDIPGAYPMKAHLAGPDEVTTGEYPGEHVLSFGPGGSPSSGLSWAWNARNEPIVVGGPGRAGSWAVCRRDLVFGSGPAFTLQPRYLYEGESMPAGCVWVDLIILCSELATLTPTDQWNHDSVNDVKCIAN